MLLPTADNLGLYKARICQVQSLLWNSKRVAYQMGLRSVSPCLQPVLLGLLKEEWLTAVVSEGCCED